MHRYRRTKVGGLSDLINVVNGSSTVNIAQAVDNTDGTIIVPTYSWTSFLGDHISKCVGIKSFHHLRFSASHKGSVFVREKSDSPKVKMKLLKDNWSPLATELPELIRPSGLTPSRQWYLYNKIREFCPDESKNITCPEPRVPDRGANPSTTTPLSTTTTSSSAEPSTTTITSEPRAKRPRLCGICKETGHNARSCPSKT